MTFQLTILHMVFHSSSHFVYQKYGIWLQFISVTHKWILLLIISIAPDRTLYQENGHYMAVDYTQYQQIFQSLEALVNSSSYQQYGTWSHSVSAMVNMLTLGISNMTIDHTLYKQIDNWSHFVSAIWHLITLYQQYVPSLHTRSGKGNSIAISFTLSDDIFV